MQLFKNKKQKIITHVHLHLLCKVLKLELVKGFSIAVLFVEAILVTREHTDLTFWYFPPYFLMHLLSDLHRVFLFVFLHICTHHAVTYLLCAFTFQDVTKELKKCKEEGAKRLDLSKSQVGELAIRLPFTLACDVHLVLWTCIFSCYFFSGA